MSDFSKHDRNILVKVTDRNGEYFGEKMVHVPANTWINANQTLLPLPVYNPEAERCYLVDGRWVVTELWVGRTIYLNHGVTIDIPMFPWEHKPEEFSLVPPPEAEEGFLPWLSKGEWDYIENLDGKIAYAKDRKADDYMLEAYDMLPDTHTLLPYEEYSVFDEEASAWVFSDELYLPVLTEVETKWHHECWSKVMRALETHKFDCEIPISKSHLRTCTLTGDQVDLLLGDRLALHNYIESEEFPHGTRPVLSSVIKY